MFALVNLPIIITEPKDTTIPETIPTIISIKCFFNKSNCLYKGIASTTVTGPKRKFIQSAPIL